MVNELVGKVAIVTGGAAGIGAAIVELFAAEGARVVIADRDSDGGEQLAERLGADVIFTKTDVADPEQVTQLVATAVERFGGLDIMVNNAGISGAMHAGFLDDDLADFHQVLGVNLLGAMAGTREAARRMVANGGGSIINVSSIGGIQAGASVMSYRASKAAVIHFTKSAAMEFAAADIRINCIAPGNIPTSLLASAVANMSAEEAERFVGAAREIMRNTKPLRRDGEARDVAEAALYFGSDRSAYVTGTILPVDGGTVAGMKSQVKDVR
ncbi:SDR family NAD(P)-dependent oxidoreductase [Nocardia sp. NPDC050630]|uniref:SDR family NAD(P)-dependent oxidoreductase n=1 Tax=Nocardia sp. NPDC050630 TaxID=3364321 RepID=UPI0037B88063